MSMTIGQNHVPDKHSELGVASSLIGAAMLIVQLVVLSAVLLGVKDNQGEIYAATIPICMYCIGVPLALVTAILGLRQRQRNHRLAKIAFVLMFSGPLLFAVFVAVTVMFHPW